MVMVEAHLIEALERFPEPVQLFNGFVIQPWKGRFVLTCHDDPVVSITPNELGGAYPARDSQYAVALVGERLLCIVNLAAKAYLRGKESAGGTITAPTPSAPEPVEMAVPASVAAAAAIPAASLDDVFGQTPVMQEDAPVTVVDEGTDGLFDEFDTDDSFDNVTPAPSLDSADEDIDFPSPVDDFPAAPEPAPASKPAPAPEPEPEPIPEPEPAPVADAGDDELDDFDLDDLPDSVDIATDADGAPAEAEIQGEMPAADEPLDQSAIDDLFG